ncbi:hypothetical protein [Acidovorax sp. CF316]|uniref:hypothetical protein n=1 Tax=Acidovorax sp. CF316 TaxID=1144317 RepID=UPI0011B26E99|nr:hypothetical protein [Acidovorax sp. CF316]
MDAFDHAERRQAAATALGALIGLVPAASVSGNIFVAILAALGTGSLAGGAVMIWWLLTAEGSAYLLAESRFSGRSTSRVYIWLGNTLPGGIFLAIAVFLYAKL